MPLAAAKKPAKAAAVPRKTAQEKKEEAARAADVWYQTTKIVVPVWFGNNSAKQGLKLSETFTPAGLLALVAVGQAAHSDDETKAACEAGMQIKLRYSGFSRQEAKDVAGRGFLEVQTLKLVKVSKKATDSFAYPYFRLSAKGGKWYRLLEESATTP